MATSRVATTVRGSPNVHASGIARSTMVGAKLKKVAEIPAALTAPIGAERPAK